MTLPRMGRKNRWRLAAARPEPLRTCVGCRQVKPRSALHRVAVVEGAIVVDPRRVNGRSAYLCREGACWDLAQKRRALDRALGSAVTAQDWARLRQGIMT
jgi:predicted RNA-binding protein YlxR (DUF448 family)